MVTVMLFCNTGGKEMGVSKEKNVIWVFKSKRNGRKIQRKLSISPTENKTGTQGYDMYRDIIRTGK